MASINFNGREYASPDAMPPDVRQLYELATGMLADKDGDGVPDLFAGADGAPIVTGMTQIVVDGRVYSGADDLPPEARERFAQAMARLDADGDGVPDLLGAGLSGAQTPAQPAPAAPAVQELPHVTVVGGGGGLTPAWLIASLVILLLSGAVVYLLLTR